jgi:hypothetical protein
MCVVCLIIVLDPRNEKQIFHLCRGQSSAVEKRYETTFCARGFTTSVYNLAHCAGGYHNNMTERGKKNKNGGKEPRGGDVEGKGAAVLA